MVNYTKLRDGSWGLRGKNLTEHACVVVKTKAGVSKTEYVGKVIWTGPDGTCIARKAESVGGSTTRRSGRRYECDECGERVMPGSKCWETGMTH